MRREIKIKQAISNGAMGNISPTGTHCSAYISDPIWHYSPTLCTIFRELKPKTHLKTTAQVQRRKKKLGFLVLAMVKRFISPYKKRPKLIKTSILFSIDPEILQLHQPFWDNKVIFKIIPSEAVSSCYKTSRNRPFQGQIAYNSEDARRYSSGAIVTNFKIAIFAL